MNESDDVVIRAGWDMTASDVRRLARSVAARGGLDPTHADDVAQDVLIRLLGLEPSRLESVEVPSAYVTTMVRNVATDLRRKELREQRVGASHATEEAPAADSVDLAHDRVVDGLHRAFAAHEADAVQAAVAWLDLSESLGQAPTLRELAEKLGVSHTAARNRLVRLRPFM